MRNLETPITNEEGSTLVIAMILLALLALIGAISINTSTTEVQTASNEMIYKRNFQIAESANLAALRMIQNMASTQAGVQNLLDHSPVWLHRAENDPGFNDPANWSTANSNPFFVDANSDSINDIPDGGRYAALERLTPGSSIGTVNPTYLHQFTVFGLYNGGDGQVLVETRYQLRY